MREKVVDMPHYGALSFDLPRHFHHGLSAGEIPIEISTRGQKAWVTETADAVDVSLTAPVALTVAGAPLLMHGLELDKQRQKLFVKVQAPLAPHDAQRWMELSHEPDNRFAKAAYLARHGGMVLAGVAGFALARGGLGPALGLVMGAQALRRGLPGWLGRGVARRLPEAYRPYAALAKAAMRGQVIEFPLDCSPAAQIGKVAVELFESGAEALAAALREAARTVDFSGTDLTLEIAPPTQAIGGPTLCIQRMQMRIVGVPRSSEANTVAVHFTAKNRLTSRTTPRARSAFTDQFRPRCHGPQHVAAPVRHAYDPDDAGRAARGRARVGSVARLHRRFRPIGVATEASDASLSGRLCSQRLRRGARRRGV